LRPLASSALGIWTVTIPLSYSAVMASGLTDWDGPAFLRCLQNAVGHGAHHVAGRKHAHQAPSV
jgi:hypothetical protein